MDQRWLIGNSLVLADEFGRPIWEKPCPKADCKFILDASAKRAFVATAVDANSTSVQEVERSGELSPAWQIPLVNVTSIGSHGKVLWLRGSQVSAYVVVAFDCQTLTSRRWLLPDAIAPQLQFITSDGAYLSMDYVHENGIDAIKIRRLEFDSLLQNGFE